LIPTPEGLAPFTGDEHIDKHQEIPFALTDYAVYGHTSAVIAGSKETALQLTDWTGRAIRSGKTGVIPSDLAPILERLNIDPDAWVENIRHYGKNYFRAVGTTDNLKRFSEVLNQQWLCGVRASMGLFKIKVTSGKSEVTICHNMK